MSKYNTIQESLIKKPKTWLITGVAGFIGSNLLEKLLILNQNVIGIDNFETGFQHNIDQALKDAFRISGKDSSNNFKFIEGDIRVFSDCMNACKDVDYVLHHAALGSVPRSIENPINTNGTNIDGFLNMLVAAKDCKVEKFIYAASSSTYGDHPDLPKIENRIGKPLSPYAVTKLVNELYAEVFSKTYGFKSIGLRYFNIFGKRQNPNGAYAAVIPRWIHSILNNDKVFIFGDGQTSRDFCYIENVVQMNILAATSSNDKSNNQVYNVALNDRTSLNRLFELILTKIQKRLKDLPNIKPVYGDFRPGDVLHSQADITKARDLLGYVPEFNIGKGLDFSIDWYIDSFFQR